MAGLFFKRNFCIFDRLMYWWISIYREYGNTFFITTSVGCQISSSISA
nr:MAG TPA: hypothetical protein [Caudoviricetes sp.]